MSFDFSGKGVAEMGWLGTAVPEEPREVDDPDGASPRSRDENPAGSTWQKILRFACAS